MSLSDDHATMLLEESGLTDEIIEARGYRTTTKKAELKKLGFTEGQCNTPGLLIPVHSPAGGIATYQHRPDEPRVGKDGKPVKYETPSRSGMALDVHPHARGKLADPNVPLFVTEGVKKGDALASSGLCAVALLGVWNWRGSNSQGGKVALPEWEYAALNGREVYVVFDSDVMLKAGVHAAMVRLKAFLEGREAEVRVVYLPPGEGAQKQGVDDYFVAGHSVADLLSHATTELREPPEGGNAPGEGATQSEILVGYADEAELFRAPDGEPYITFPVEAA